LAALADNVQLLARQLDDLFKSLFKVHFVPFARLVWPANTAC
jgi:hypothetical protein